MNKMIAVDLFAADIVQDRRTTRAVTVPTDFDVGDVRIEYTVHSPEVQADPAFTLDTELWGLFDAGWQVIQSREFPASPLPVYRASPATKLRVIFEPSRPTSISVQLRFLERVL